MIPKTTQLGEFDILKGHSEESSQYLNSLYEATLLNPVNNFLSRPRKGFRFELIYLGYEIAAEIFYARNPHKSNLPEAPLKVLQLFDEVIELLHSGSLIVDDIEDQSQMRRGQKTLHNIYGMPTALNAGNWLYFWPLIKIQNSSLLKPELQQKALAECLQTLFFAHTGQALDIGVTLTQVPRLEVQEVILKTMELKSGALASLAMTLGALSLLNHEEISQSEMKSQTEVVFEAIQKFGNHFGQILQIYDDIGNLTSAANPEKQFEDLRLLRPSFIWSVLAKKCEDQDYQNFFSQIQKIKVESPQDPQKMISYLQEILANKEIQKTAITEAAQITQTWKQEFFQKIPNLSQNLKIKIETILERLSHAY
jgi:octaprenyl-diphosphate synthase